MDTPNPTPSSTDSSSNAPARKRLAPGERKLQILQALAQQLEQNTADRITTASLARQLQVSEAALYRHFASKAQMFEGLLEFIESTLQGLFNQVMAQQTDTSAATTARTLARMVTMMLQFAQTNPGMARVMVGDALVLEAPRLQERMIAFFDKIEANLRQVMRENNSFAQTPTPTALQQAMASTLVAFALGRMQRYVRSHFRKNADEQLDVSLQLLLQPFTLASTAH